ncbi:MAG: VWA domain-containing protein [Planctomycetota bacterium]|nr:MAG: VWA domain-containing protein [Planctomycetota bacterium]
MGVILRDPWWLALAVTAIPLAWIGLRLFRAMSRARAISAVVARVALVALVASALAGAASVQRSDRVAVIAVIDVSDSVRLYGEFGVRADGTPRPYTEAVRDWLERAASARGPDDLLGVVVFDGSSAALAAPAPPGVGSGRDRGTGWTPADLPLDVRMREGTDLAGALRFASALFPPGARRRLVVISDGVQTRGDALAAARALAGGAGATGAPAPIDILPALYRAQRETMVEFVDAPPTAARESAITVRVGLRATAPTTGTLRLMREGVEVDINGDAPGSGLRVSLAPGRQVVPIEVRVPSQTVHRFRAVFEPDPGAPDTVAQNNAGEAFTVTPGRGRTLVVDGVSGGAGRGAGAILPDTLRRAGIEVDVAPPASAPADPLALQEYDLIILNNVPADAMPRGVQGLYASYVRDLGGGLVMVGGVDSFGAGGWNGGPVEDVLPVEMDLPEDLIVPSAAIMIVMDSSGSMGQSVLGGARSQQEIANEAAALAIQTLDASDLVGVIAFDSTHRTVVPLGPNRDPEASARKVRSIAPGGGTNLYPALAEAGARLRQVEAQVKLVIVLSDGQSQGSAQWGASIAAGMAQDDIRVSTIAVGDGADTQTLRAIAAAGAGEYYRVVDPNLLPQIFIREVRVVRKPMVREAVFQPVLAGSGSPLTAGLGSPLPTLGGLVLTQPRPEATAIDAILAPDGSPVLAHWNVGLGRAAAWTSDASRWARAWIESGTFGTVWTAIARATARPASSQNYDVTAEVRDGRLSVRLDAADDQGDPIDLLTVPGDVYTPSGEKIPITLEQVGPGVYEGVAPTDESGAHILTLTPRLGGRRLAPIVAGAAGQTSPEHQRLESDLGLLRRLAQTTGGRLLSWDATDPAELYDRSGLAPTRAMSPLWPVLLAWAVGVMLVDVGTRRVAWDRLLSSEIAAAIRLHAAEAGRGGRAVATLDQLRGRSERVRAEQTAPRPGARPEPTSAAAGVGPGPTDDGRGSIRRALAPERATAGPAPAEAPRPDSADGEGRASTAGLLAAKRRARERFERPEDGA